MIDRYALRRRTQASAIHFSFSLIIFAAFVWTLLTLWYPEPYFTASGGWQGLKLVALVDIVLGPLVMFAIFNPAKEKAKLLGDIVVIITLQLGALIWGVVQVYQQRPLAAAFFEDRFYVVSAAELGKDAQQQLAQFDSQIPAMVYVRPARPEEVAENLKRMRETHLPPYAFVERYQPYQQQMAEISQFAADAEAVISHNPAMGERYRELLTASGLSPQETILLPLISKYHNVLILMDMKGGVHGYLDAPYKRSDQI
ncbi:MAG: hypothetical protein HQL49_03380 [Gammaproteobacteria bacterium]|nr:hypothetical protein [Gammaproteobacteria bacterium]